MAFTFGDNADFAQNQALNMTLQVLGSDPSTPVLGQTYFNSGTNLIRTYNGSTWTEYSAGGNTNLTFSRDATTVTVESDTGTDAILPVATGTLAGVSENNLTGAEKTILGNTSGTNSGDEVAATTTVEGVAEIATQAEVDAGSEAGAKFVTPATLQVKIDASVVGLWDDKGNYNASTNTPNLDTAPSGILKGDTYYVNVAGTAFFTEVLEVGDVLRALQDDPTTAAHWAKTQTNLDDASIKTKYENNADTNAYTDADQTTVGNQSGTNTGDEVTATDAIEGVAEIATQTEVNTGTEAGAKFVTPATLQSKLGVTGTLNNTVSFRQAIGDTAATTIVVTHNIGKQFVETSVYRTASPYDKVYPTIECDTTNATSFTFSAAPGTDEFTVVISG